jgi:hypothetical protein
MIGTRFAPYLFPRRRSALYCKRTGALAQYTLDMGHTGNQALSWAIQARILRILNRSYSAYGTYKSHRRYNSLWHMK